MRRVFRRCDRGFSVSSCRCQTRRRPMVGAPSGGGGARDGQGQRGEWRLNFGG
ncbi:hypothetical protein V6Z12_A08G242200 [Gossypium hirsutum]|uniref:Uncharacterized protein n=1 Tax=Gossypium darwinii TaxID=34276 RepID=A0A5D2FQF2_GOSDA|nr:hypothetical protein ES288_A08G255700v1 [Gossypium darwinii]